MQPKSETKRRVTADSFCIITKCVVSFGTKLLSTSKSPTLSSPGSGPCFLIFGDSRKLWLHTLKDDILIRLQKYLLFKGKSCHEERSLKTDTLEVFQPWCDFFAKRNDVSAWSTKSKSEKLKISGNRGWMPVAHTCNPSYSGGWDQVDCGSRPAWADNSQDPHLKQLLSTCWHMSFIQM
jgi:hypothetical protein